MLYEGSSFRTGGVSHLPTTECTEQHMTDPGPAWTASVGFLPRSASQGENPQKALSGATAKLLPLTIELHCNVKHYEQL